MVLSISRVYNIIMYTYIIRSFVRWCDAAVIPSTTSFQGEPRAFCCTMSFTWKCLCCSLAQCLFHSIPFFLHIDCVVSLHIPFLPYSPILIPIPPPTHHSSCLFCHFFSLFNLVLNIPNVSVLLCLQCHCCCFG